MNEYAIQKRKEKIKFGIVSVISLCVFFGVWYLCTAVLHLKPDYVLPSPVQVVEAFFEKLTQTAPDGATLGGHILASLQVALTGYLLGAVIGIPLGIAMAWFRKVDMFVTPLFDLIRPVPTIAWIPLMIVWVGVGITAKALIIFFAAFVSCVINAYTGIRQTNPALINVAKTYGASNFYTFIHVGIPSAVPMIFAGLKIALSTSWGTLVAAEMLAASSGLGYMISMARQFGRADIVVLGMVVIGLLGFLFNFIFNIIEAFVNKGGSV